MVEGWPEGVDPVEHFESFGLHVELFFAFQEAREAFARSSEIVEQERSRMSAQAAWSRYFDDTDVFVCPANFTPAFPHDGRPLRRSHDLDTRRGAALHQPAVLDLARIAGGLPAVVAPIGRTPSGLPVGAQLIGPLYEDDTALTFAELLAKVVGGYEPPAI